MRFPTIADHLVTRGTFINNAMGGKRDLMIPMARQQIKMATKVNLDAISEWYWMDPRESPWMEVDTPNLLLPYDRMWFEWEVPKVNSHGEVPKGAGHYYASHIHFAPVNPANLKKGVTVPDNAKFELVCVLIGADDYELGISPAVVAYVDKDGNWVGWATSDNFGEAAQNHIISNLMIPFMGISLMNCRNVDLEYHEPVVRRAKKQRREKPVPLAFHTIKLPNQSNKRTQSNPGEPQEIMPFHLVRGHFKTYTKEAPLLGRITGTYWWGPQARGQKKNGIVVKDYEVASK
jgi:hypothetical protein